MCMCHEMQHYATADRFCFLGAANIQRSFVGARRYRVRYRTINIPSLAHAIRMNGALSHYRGNSLPPRSLPARCFSLIPHCQSVLFIPRYEDFLTRGLPRAFFFFRPDVAFSIIFYLFFSNVVNSHDIVNDDRALFTEQRNSFSTYLPAVRYTRAETAISFSRCKSTNVSGSLAFGRFIKSVTILGFSNHRNFQRISQHRCAFRDEGRVRRKKTENKQNQKSFADKCVSSTDPTPRKEHSNRQLTQRAGVPFSANTPLRN